MACCPFHDDTTPSMSVDAVPGRFTCFGCGATGDVIDYVRRLRGLSFREAVALLNGTPAPTVAVRPHVPVPSKPSWSVPIERAHEVNALAWAHLSTPVAASFARSWLGQRRGIDVTALEATVAGGRPVAGYASTSWSSLTRQLLREEVTAEELIELDLAHPTRHGHLIDSYRGRLMLPVTDDRGHITGFIGRDVTGEPGVPKYRNPTSTPVYAKSEALYRPPHVALGDEASVVIVEGPLDALAIAATAAQNGKTSLFAPCTPAGVTASPSQLDQVLALGHGPPVIALDGDEAGRIGTLRWVAALCLDRASLALVTTLPPEVDPADWLARTDAPGLDAFDRRLAMPGAPTPWPRLPGPELLHALRETQRAGIDPTAALAPLLSRLPPATANALLRSAAAPPLDRQPYDLESVTTAGPSTRLAGRTPRPQPWASPTALHSGGRTPVAEPHRPRL